MLRQCAHTLRRSVGHARRVEAQAGQVASKMASGGCEVSAAAAARVLHRGNCLAPDGEHVAVITVSDALSGWKDGCPRYETVQIGHFSVQGENREYVDGAVQKRYLRAPIPWRPEWNLNIGYEDAVRRKKATITHSLLRWVSLNSDKVVASSPYEDRPSSAREKQSPRPNFICGRYNLATLLCTPFEEKQAWRIVACRHRGIVYIHDIPAEEGQWPSHASVSWEHDRRRYWGTKFHCLMTTNEPGAVSEEDEAVRETDTYHAMLRCQLGSHTIVMNAQVKAVDPMVQCEPGSTAGHVEFKTGREAQRDKFYGRTLLRWWARSRLAGVPRAFCGFRDDNGILLDIQEFDFRKRPEEAKGKWSEDICLKFGDKLLSFIKEHVEGNDGRTIYHFEYVPSSSEIVCKRLTDPGKLYGLPDWFLEAF